MRNALGRTIYLFIIYGCNVSKSAVSTDIEMWIRAKKIIYQIQKAVNNIFFNILPLFEN